MLIVGLFSPQVSDAVKIAGTSVIEILTIFGVLNNPVNPNGF
jgi:hypothetical protein